MIYFNMRAFTDEFTKIAQVGKAVGKVTEFLKQHAGKLKWPAILGAGYVGGKTIERGAKDLSLGRKVRKQYESRGG